MSSVGERYWPEEDFRTLIQDHDFKRSSKLCTLTYSISSLFGGTPCDQVYVQCLILTGHRYTVPHFPLCVYPWSTWHTPQHMARFPRLSPLHTYHCKRIKIGSGNGLGRSSSEMVAWSSLRNYRRAFPVSHEITHPCCLYHVIGFQTTQLAFNCQFNWQLGSWSIHTNYSNCQNIIISSCLWLIWCYTSALELPT